MFATVYLYNNYDTVFIKRYLKSGEINIGDVF